MRSLQDCYVQCRLGGGVGGFQFPHGFVRQKLVFLHNNPYTIPFDSVACVFNI